jgi:hypothetical protein
LGGRERGDPECEKDIGFNTCLREDATPNELLSRTNDNPAKDEHEMAVNRKFTDQGILSVLL